MQIGAIRITARKEGQILDGQNQGTLKVGFSDPPLCQAAHWGLYFFNSLLPHSIHVGVSPNIIPILQMEKLRPREWN